MCGSTPDLQLSVTSRFPSWYQFFDCDSPGCVACQTEKPSFPRKAAEVSGIEAKAALSLTVL